MIAVSFCSTSAGKASYPCAIPHLERCIASLTSSNEILSSKPVSTGGDSSAKSQALLLVLHPYHCYLAVPGNNLSADSGLNLDLE